MNSMRQTLFFNGVVLTMNVDRPDVGAVLTEGERIVQVGNHRDIADHRRIRREANPRLGVSRYPLQPAGER